MIHEPTVPRPASGAAALLGGEVEAGAARVARGSCGTPRSADARPADGRLVRISVRTLQRWRAAWASGKLAALEPRQRAYHDLTGTERGLVAFLRTEKRC